MEKIAFTLEGEGTPYMLDPISGEITPISDYSVTEDRKIEMTLSGNRGRRGRL